MDEGGSVGFNNNKEIWIKEVLWDSITTKRYG